MSNFRGAKAAIYLGDKLLVNLRDDKRGLRYRNTWDFPGGGRSGNESPLECVIRETKEEFGIELAPTDFVYEKQYQAIDFPNEAAWFFVAKADPLLENKIQFGDEGQRWELWTPEQVLASTEFVPFLQERLRKYLEEKQPQIQRFESDIVYA